MNVLSSLGIPGPQSLGPVRFACASGVNIPALAGPVNTRNLLASITPDPIYGAVRVPTPCCSECSGSGEVLISLPLDPRAALGTVEAYRQFSMGTLRSVARLYANKLQFNPCLEFPFKIDLPDGPSGWSIEGLNDVLVSLSNPSTGATLEVAGHEDHSSIEAGWCGNGVTVSQKTSIVDRGPEVFTEGYLLRFGSIHGLARLLGISETADMNIARKVAEIIYQSGQYAAGELGEMRLDEDYDAILRSERQVEDGPLFIASLLIIKILEGPDAFRRGIEICINRRGETTGPWPLVPKLYGRFWESAMAMVSGRHPA